ncbi:MAG: S8 family serine peptidase [Planctomycetes bacterium]|nr:S8 family serine peptidase [Planctomycetota bacterium]
MASWRHLVSVVVLTVAAAAAAAALAQETRFRTPVDGPDVFGGYASTHVLVRLVPGVQPEPADAGRAALVKAQATPTEQDREAALADLLAHWQVTAIRPTADPQPQNVRLARQLGLDRHYTIRVPRGSDTPALVAELRDFPTHIELAELDGVGGTLQTFPNDTYFGNQYSLHNTGQNIQGQTGTPDADIDAPEAWELHTGTADVVLAIIDSGVSHSHPDLAGKLLPGRNTYDGNDDADDSWLISHGSHCAGIAAAISNNGQGIAGVSWGALIMPVKVTSDLGTGEESNCANGVIWAADHGANVGSMSLGYDEGTTYFHDAITYAHQQGMVLCVATGNTAGADIFFPARWPETIAVGATDNRDNLADFTTTGPEMSVAAPGVDNYSCWDTLFNPDTYTYESGTSMACPHVAGLACLVWSANLSLTNDEVRTIIESTADDKGPAGWDEQFGHGRINARAAVQAALEPQYDLGDLNCDGLVNGFDIDHFIQALDDMAAYIADHDGDPYPPCDPWLADINQDGYVNGFDIDAFVALLG